MTSIILLRECSGIAFVKQPIPLRHHLALMKPETKQPPTKSVKKIDFCLEGVHVKKFYCFFECYIGHNTKCMFVDVVGCMAGYKGMAPRTRGGPVDATPRGAAAAPAFLQNPWTFNCSSRTIPIWKEKKKVSNASWQQDTQ